MNINKCLQPLFSQKCEVRRISNQGPLDYTNIIAGNSDKTVSTKRH